MSLFPVGFARNALSVYEVERSLRHRSGVSPYLVSTRTAFDNRRVWTWSAWVKRGTLNVAQTILSAYIDVNNRDFIRIESDNTITFISFRSSVIETRIRTTNLFIDPTSYFHIVMTFDSTNPTVADRQRMYINGIRELSLQTVINVPLDYNLGLINGPFNHYIGRAQEGSYFDGHMTEINFVDGYALEPSEFGEYSSTTGEWIPKRYSGQYGSNGYYLPYTNGSTISELGFDCKPNSFRQIAANSVVGSTISTADAPFGSSSILVNGAFGSHVLYAASSRYNLTNGVLYLYIAFAESPLKYSNAF